MFLGTALSICSPRAFHYMAVSQPYVQHFMECCLVVLIIQPIAGDLTVPMSNTRDEQQIVAITENFDPFPVLVRGTTREPIKGEITVNSTRATCKDVNLVVFLHYQSNKDGVIG